MCLLIVYRGQIYLEKRITLFFIKNFVAEALALFHCVDCTSGNIIMEVGNCGDALLRSENASNMGPNI